MACVLVAAAYVHPAGGRDLHASAFLVIAPLLFLAAINQLPATGGGCCSSLQSSPRGALFGIEVTIIGIQLPVAAISARNEFQLRRGCFPFAGRPDPGMISVLRVF